MSGVAVRLPCRIVGEPEFAAALQAALRAVDLSAVVAVTGPGRSGAIAAAYTSHLIGVPFIPQGASAPQLGRLLIVDTARQSGRTLRKMARRYEAADPIVVAVYEEPPRVSFWYEAPKPQRYRHEMPIGLGPVAAVLPASTEGGAS